NGKRGESRSDGERVDAGAGLRRRYRDSERSRARRRHGLDASSPRRAVHDVVGSVVELEVEVRNRRGVIRQRNVERYDLTAREIDPVEISDVDAISGFAQVAADGRGTSDDLSRR